MFQVRWFRTVAYALFLITRAVRFPIFLPFEGVPASLGPRLRTASGAPDSDHGGCTGLRNPSSTHRARQRRVIRRLGIARAWPSAARFATMAQNFDCATISRATERLDLDRRIEAGKRPRSST